MTMARQKKTQLTFCNTMCKLYTPFEAVSLGKSWVKHEKRTRLLDMCLIPGVRRQAGCSVYVKTNKLRLGAMVIRIDVAAPCIVDRLSSSFIPEARCLALLYARIPIRIPYICLFVARGAYARFLRIRLPACRRRKLGLFAVEYVGTIPLE